MGSDRVQIDGKSSSSLTPGFKTQKFSFLQRRYQDQVEAKTDSLTEEKQLNSSEQANTTPPFLGHSFGRISVRPIQAKLTIGQPGDKYEQEADRVASQVVKQINATDTAQSTQGAEVQRMEEEEEELQAKPSISDLQRSPLFPVVQREAMPEEEDLQAKSTLQGREAIAGGEASPDLTSAIARARGSGQALPTEVQKKMGQAMGADFTGVRVHTDAQSDQLNQSLQAKAFTTGQDVFFRRGEYQPGSRGGQELIAHELTHVVQQNGQSLQRQVKKQEGRLDKLEINSPQQTVGLEKEADMMWTKTPNKQEKKEDGQSVQNIHRNAIQSQPINVVDYIFSGVTQQKVIQCNGNEESDNESGWGNWGDSDEDKGETGSDTGPGSKSEIQNIEGELIVDKDIKIVRSKNMAYKMVKLDSEVKLKEEMDYLKTLDKHGLCTVTIHSSEIEKFKFGDMDYKGYAMDFVEGKHSKVNKDTIKNQLWDIGRQNDPAKKQKLLLQLEQIDKYQKTKSVIGDLQFFLNEDKGFVINDPNGLKPVSESTDRLIEQYKNFLNNEGKEPPTIKDVGSKD